MNQIQCPSCGSIKLIEDDRYYICEYCGGKIERTQPIEAADVSNASGVTKLLERADLYWSVGKRDKAKRLYQQVLDIDASIERARTRAR